MLESSRALIEGGEGAWRLRHRERDRDRGKGGKGGGRDVVTMCLYCIFDIRSDPSHAAEFSKKKKAKLGCESSGSKKLF